MFVNQFQFVKVNRTFVNQFQFVVKQAFAAYFKKSVYNLLQSEVFVYYESVIIYELGLFTF
jgi:hypothetical protein